MKFSQTLAFLRKEKGLTHEELAKQIGYSRAIIGFWENEKKQPTLDALIALANYFDVTLDFLTGRTDEAGRKNYTEEFSYSDGTHNISHKRNNR